MKAQYQVVQQDFLEAHHMHRFAQRMVRLLLALFVAGLAAGVYLMFTGQAPAGVLLISALLALYAVLFATPHLDARRRAKTDPAARSTVTIEFSEEGAVQVIEDVERRWHWSAVREFIETPNLILFHHHDGTRTVLPKRAFTADQLAFLDQLARHRIPTQARP